ncbi:MAG TPA: SDR family NAD(P)-dependent oxidoreductase [Chloroflexota bacterium]|nr:SDR family NAD(P)-dependent oxidoreductase [Chloroflexota bacterium]
MELRLDGQVAIVTGSTMGIGKAIALAYGQAGARVVVNSRDEARARGVADELGEAGVDAYPVAADVSQADEVARLFEATDQHWGRLDVLVNNAGTNAIGPSEHLALLDWQRTIDLNLTGAFLCAQAAAQRMLPRGRGVIINISSILGETALPQRAAYCSAKHGLNGLTKVLAVEWASRGIRVHAINPAYIATSLDVEDQASGGYSVADIERRTPLGRYGTVEEVANTALFLASDLSTYLTGSRIDVDGGWLANGGW